VRHILVGRPLPGEEGSRAVFDERDLNLIVFSELAQDEPLDLSRASFLAVEGVTVDFTNVILAGADFTGAILPSAILINADLTEAVFHNATLSQADLTDATLVRTNLENADLTSATLANATLRPSNITGASLAEADLRGVDLTDATLAGVKLDKADLRDAITRNTDFAGTKLTAVNIADTDFRFARGFFVDSTDVRGTRYRHVKTRWHEEFCRGRCRLTRGIRALARWAGYKYDAIPSDRWSVLRQSYAGPKYFLLLLSLGLFALPYVGRVVWFTGVGAVEKAAVQLAGGYSLIAEDGDGITFRPIALPTDPLLGRVRALRENLRALETMRARLPGFVRSAIQNSFLGRFVRAAEGVVLAADSLQTAVESLPRHTKPLTFKKRSVGGLILRSDRGCLAFTVAILLIAYNVLVFLLVNAVAPLRDEEERSGFSPAFEDYAGRWSLEWWHRWIATPLSYLAWIVLIWNIVEVLCHPSYVLELSL
jgi:uncharacterized protein YjbI with pentapeptide repeats